MCVSSDISSEGVYPSLFMSALSSQSDRTLSLCWEQHCKLLPGVQGIHANQVAAWSVEEVSKPHQRISLSFHWVLFVFKAWCVFVAGLQVCSESYWLWRTGSSLQRRGENKCLWIKFCIYILKCRELFAVFTLVSLFRRENSKNKSVTCLVKGF